VRSSLLNQLSSLNELIRFVPHLGDKLQISISEHESEWTEFLRSEFAESCIPPSLCPDIRQSSPIAFGFLTLILLKTLRIERFVSGLHHILSIVFGDNFLAKELDFRAAYSATTQNSPILLCSKPGYDASNKVDELASTLKINDYRPIAIGSREGFDIADKAIAQASKTGGWVLLKNVHLAPHWLLQLVKKLYQLCPSNHGYSVYFIL